MGVRRSTASTPAGHYNNYPVRNEIIYRPATVTPVGSPVAMDASGVLVVGDLNSYAQEDPISTLEHGGLIDLVERYEGVGITFGHGRSR